MNVFRVEGMTDGGIKFIHVLAPTIEEAIAHARKNGIDVSEARRCLLDVQTLEVI